MLEVNLIKKSTDLITKEVKRNIASTKELQKPDINNKNCYNNFIDEIAKSFNIENKKEIILLAIDLEEDEIPIGYSFFKPKTTKNFLVFLFLKS